MPGQWHLPYVTADDNLEVPVSSVLGFTDKEELRRISTARCARVSYRTFEGRTPSRDEDLALYARLLSRQPVHASPAEHQATPDEIWPDRSGVGKTFKRPDLHGNFYGWIQHRKLIQGEHGEDFECGIEGVL